MWVGTQTPTLYKGPCIITNAHGQNVICVPLSRGTPEEVHIVLARKCSLPAQITATLTHCISEDCKMGQESPCNLKSGSLLSNMSGNWGQSGRGSGDVTWSQVYLQLYYQGAVLGKAHIRIPGTVSASSTELVCHPARKMSHHAKDWVWVGWVIVGTGPPFYNRNFQRIRYGCCDLSPGGPRSSNI